MSLLSRIANVFRADRLTREIDDEIQSHLAEAADQGRDPHEARRAFGSPLHLREHSRDLRLLSWLESLRADIVFGCRQLVKRKVTTAAAVLSLALAIGACTAAFTLIDALLFRPLPISHPERLYVLARRGFGPGGDFRTSEGTEYPLFRTLRDVAKDQANLLQASWAARADLTYGADEDMERPMRQYVSGRLFESFGLSPAAGRLFSDNDDLTPGAHPVVVLSYDYWSRRFGRDPHVLGRTLRMDNRVYSIVGVAPQTFSGTEPGVAVDIFVPAMMNPYAVAPDSSWFRTFVHLKAGVAPAALRDRMYPPYQAIQDERAMSIRGRSAQAVANFRNQELILEPASSGMSDVQKDYSTALAALGVLVALVLLIACANVANLMTAQTAARAREMALRVSIGAGRARLVQMVLIESAILAALAAALGAWFASWAAPLVADRIKLYLPGDWRVAVFGAILTLVAACLFGLAPALRASSVHPAAALRGGTSPHSRGRTMHALIALQVAFCFVVLFVAGLFVTTLGRLAHQSPGFSSERLLVLDVVSERPQPQASWDQVAERLRAAPGVERVAMASWPLLSNTGMNGSILFNGAPANNSLAYFLGVSPGWIDTMRVPLIDGRDFRPDDTFPQVAIVNQAFARVYFHGENPVGRWFEKMQSKTLVRIQVIGLIGDTRYRNAREPITPTVFVPFQMTERSRAILIRTAAPNPLAMASLLRREVPRARSEFRVSNVRTQQELLDQSSVRERLLALLGFFFAAVALSLAAIGLYGVLDYSVLQRRREISIRMAIGAPAARIAAGVTAQVFLMVFLGALAGIGLGLLSARSVAALLYQVQSSDPAMLALPALIILSAAVLAALPPVIRAVRTDPAAALRSE